MALPMKLSNSFFRWRLPVLALIIILTGAAIPGLFKLNVSLDMEDYFIENGPAVENEKKFHRLFNNNDFVGVLVENEDIFSQESLELIREIGIKLKESVPLGNKVVSICSLGEFPLGGRPFLFNKGILLTDAEEVEEIRRFYSDIPSIGGTLFSKDFRQAWILLTLRPYPEGGITPFDLGKAAYNTIASISSGSSTLTATGVPVYAYRKKTEMMDELRRVLTFGALVALFLSILIIQSLRGVSGTLIVIVLSVVWALGLQGWLRIAIDSAFISVPILLTMGVSIGYTVHVSRFFVLYHKKRGCRKDSVLNAVRESGKPIVFTAFTTIAAMLSFIAVEIKPIRWVGITSALGILFACFLTLLAFPYYLSFGGNKKIGDTSIWTVVDLETMLNRFFQWASRYEKTIVLLFCLSVGAAIPGILMLKIDFNAVKMMGSRLQHMRDQIHIGQSEIAASDTLDLVLQFPKGRLRERDTLVAMESFEKQLSENPIVKRITSLTRVVREINFLHHETLPLYNRIPPRDASVRGLLAFSERIASGALRPWVDEDYSSARIFFELRDFSSSGIEELIHQIEEIIPGVFPGDTDFFFSGSTHKMAAMNQIVTRGLVRSILTALLLITTLLIFLFRSIKFGLIAMIPNVYPILIAGALMGYAGIPLEFVTMTVAPMVMGLAVDDTIHFITRIKRDLKKTGDSSESIRTAFSTVGIAITETTTILCLSFFVFAISDMNSIRNMGILAGSGMLAAYLADIFITPILIRRMH